MTAPAQRPPGVADARDLVTVELDIGGMTCAACAARVEKKLSRMDGVEASVNYATERATVRHRPDVAVEDLVATVEATGYTAAPVGGGDDDGGEEPDDRAASPVEELRRRVLISAALTVPVLLMSMVPPLQFRNWQWLSLTLAAPVVVWGAWPFHRAAWVNLRHGAATMDTLISVGTLAAFAWSVRALFWGDAGMPGMTMPFSLEVRRGGEDEIYLEVATAVTLFVLAGIFGGAVSVTGVLVGAVYFVPGVARMLGSLAARAGGVPGKVAAANSVRNPRRTTATASALLIGAGLVTMMATGAATARDSLASLLDENFPVDVAVQAPWNASGVGSLTATQVAAVESTDGVARTDTMPPLSTSSGRGSGPATIGTGVSRPSVRRPARTPSARSVTLTTGGGVPSTRGRLASRPVSIGSVVRVATRPETRLSRTRFSTSIGLADSSSTATGRGERTVPEHDTTTP